MRHRSLWKKHELEKLGYRVRGVKPVREWIPPLIARYFPYFACDIMAIKVINAR